MEEKTKKIYKELDEADWSKKIHLIVDQLVMQASSKDLVTEIVKELNGDYGIKKTVIRKVATSVYKHNQDELQEESKEILDLIDLCD